MSGVYVIRQTPDIERDIARGWSAHRAMRCKTVEEVFGSMGWVDEMELEDAWDEWSGSSPEDREEFLLDYAEAHDYDIERDPHSGEWCWVHHRGLCCYDIASLLDIEFIESVEVARREGRRAAEYIDDRWGGSGQAGEYTLGAVEIVERLYDDWWLLRCEDTMSEL